LAQDGLSPLEAERVQRRENVIGAARRFSGRIEIFDADQPLAAGVARAEVAADRGDQRTEVQQPGGRRSEAAAVGKEVTGDW
jgi:hypothetical protein